MFPECSLCRQFINRAVLKPLLLHPSQLHIPILDMENTAVKGKLKAERANTTTQVREHSVNIQGTFSEHSGNIQGTFREHCTSPSWIWRIRPSRANSRQRRQPPRRSGNIQGTFSEHSGNIPGTFR
jgi:hypothetical protein